MKEITLTKNEIRALGILAIFGVLVPNGVFLYYFLTDPEVARSALSNPVSIVFIGEAFFLMLLFAWLLWKAGARKPGGFVFILMSLIGSMVFSVPATLYLLLKGRKKKG